ncbi:hypothetical protein DC487_07340 [Sphingobacterium corticibacter]|uniref:Uncharacterized protein n=1 Tax=Sphingobacterium corticibacter TaxID=2171749 RepID=A0A2T8HK24_9SPHI|nr:hypothetical protein DC487_07340 [Sphingobacterium corticibacter]
MKNIHLFLKLIVIICSPFLFLIGSCNKKNPVYIPEPPVIEPTIYNQCANDGDIYKLLFDTLVINSKREMYTIDAHEIKYKLDNAMPLGVCEKTARLYGTAQYSPLSAIVKTDENISRPMNWDTRGYFRDIILEEDIDRIISFPDGKEIKFQLSLLNHSEEVIQTSPIVLIYQAVYPNK